MKKTHVSKYYDHDPRHYRFQRKVSGFYPADDCDSNCRAAIITAIMAVVVIVVTALA